MRSLTYDSQKAISKTSVGSPVFNALLELCQEDGGVAFDHLELTHDNFEVLLRNQLVLSGSIFAKRLDVELKINDKLTNERRVDVVRAREGIESSNAGNVSKKARFAFETALIRVKRSCIFAKMKINNLRAHKTSKTQRTSTTSVKPAT